MIAEALRVGSYRFVATFRRRWRDYAGLALLIALIGGLAIGSISASRRTQSSFSRFMASTNPSDLTVSSYGLGDGSTATAYSPELPESMRTLPNVKRMASWVGALGAPLGPDGAPQINAQVNMVGSVDGLYFSMDRAVATVGRMADPRRSDEFVTTAIGARLLGLHVGQVVPMGFYAAEDGTLPGFGTPSVPPRIRKDMKLVGLVVFSNEIVEDDVDRLPTNVVFTPSLTSSLIAIGATQGTWSGLQLVHGRRDVASVERELIGAFPPGSFYNFRVTSIATAKVERAIKPEAIAVGAFGLIAAIASLVIAALAISRLLHVDDADRDVLRALGAGPVMTASDGVLGILGAIVVGSLLAGAVAVALSPLGPMGPVRRVYPGRGVAADWAVLASGLAVLILCLSIACAVLARRGAPHRVAQRSESRADRSSPFVQAAVSAGLPPAGVVGVRFATESGRGRTAVPVRSALIGASVAVFMVVTTITFASGLRTLVSRPPLYGWNWSYALGSINNIPPQARDLLDHDPKVAAWAGYNEIDGQVDGQNVPILVGDSHPRVSPPILSGHAVGGADQIVIGPATLARLHKHVGDTVDVSYGSPADAPFYVPPTPLKIVGAATLPSVAASTTLADHTSMGVGALLSADMVPAAFADAVTNPDPTLQGPTLAFVRLRDHVSAADGLADMHRIAEAGNQAFAADQEAVGDMVNVLTVQRPAEIVNYRSTGATPVALAAGLAVGAIAALGLTLNASVRRRRRDLAVLKALGFTRRQLATSVAWQASVVAAIGTVIGLPLGIASGRWLWTVFARAIYVVPRPTVPASVAVVAVGALLLANVVAVVPGLTAAHTRVTVEAQ